MGRAAAAAAATAVRVTGRRGEEDGEKHIETRRSSQVQSSRFSVWIQKKPAQQIVCLCGTFFSCRCPPPSLVSSLSIPPSTWSLEGMGLAGWLAATV